MRRNVGDAVERRDAARQRNVGDAQENECRQKIVTPRWCSRWRRGRGNGRRYMKAARNRNVPRDEAEHRHQHRIDRPSERCRRSAAADRRAAFPRRQALGRRPRAMPVASLIAASASVRPNLEQAGARPSDRSPGRGQNVGPELPGRGVYVECAAQIDTAAPRWRDRRCTGDAIGSRFPCMQHLADLRHVRDVSSSLSSSSCR